MAAMNCFVRVSQELYGRFFFSLGQEFSKFCCQNPFTLL